MGKHSEWRKLAKKSRRKRLRREIAIFRKNTEDEEQKRRDNSPTYIRWLDEQKQQEDFQAKEEERLAKLAEAEYLERERLAQKAWEELQQKLAIAKEERTRQIAKIKEEWDREQKKLNEAKEKREREEEEKRKREELLQTRIEEFVSSNADMPDELNQNLESNPGKDVCPFFKKTATCRFGDSCSRNHVKPIVSGILVFRNFYTHYSLERTAENEHGSDSILEFDSSEIYEHFKEFFYDVFYEVEKLGELVQFKVCCNREGHLRGNVYIEYADCRQAVKAYRLFQGRWYGGKQLNVEFCSIESWKSAICGLFFRQKCPKGSNCNYLHVFRNPRNLFNYADRDLHRIPKQNEERNWRWSESPERFITDETNKRSNDEHKKTRRRRDSSESNDKRRHVKRHSQSKSKSRDRSRHRSSSRSSRSKRDSKRHKSRRS